MPPAGTSAAHRATIRAGTCGWSFPDWNGIVYPADRPRGFRELHYLSRFLDAVEVNTTFYRPPPPAYCRRWLRDVEDNPRFAFTLKLWQRFTHERDEPWSEADVRTFRTAVAPLAESRRLGALLVQFPWSFPRSEANEDWLRRIAGAFADLPLVVEVRHASWLGEEAEEFFRAERLNFCNIDQPASRQSVGHTNLATGPVAYYRFHGRNREKWFDRNAGRDERYDYLYSEEELAPWLRDIAAAAERVEQIYVMANNHYRGQAFVNALQTKAALEARPVEAPPTLLERYPVLSGVVRPAPGERSLFGAP